MKLLIHVFFRTAPFIFIILHSTEVLSFDIYKPLSFYSENKIISYSSRSNYGTDPSKSISRVDIRLKLNNLQLRSDVIN